MTVSRHHGKWRYDFIMEGTRHRKGGFNTKQEAKNEEVEARKRATKINMDFVRLCENRLEDLELRRTRKHFRENELFLKNIYKIWGAQKVITTEDVEQYLKGVAREQPNGKSHDKANKHLKMLKALFNLGVQKRWLSQNPCQGIKKFSVHTERRYVPPLEDILKVLQVANAEQQRYLLVIAYTMARVREINNLTWQDITPNFLILRTRKSRNSDIAERKIPLNSSLRRILEAIPITGQYVFMNKRTRKNYDYRKKLLKRLCKKAEVPYFTFHSLRHFGASLLAKQGTPITDIQTLLGHQRATTTDLYLRSLGHGLVEATGMLEIISPPELTPKNNEEEKAE